MRSYRVSASKVHLLQYCQAFAQPEMVWEERTTDLGDRGTRLHKLLADYARGLVPTKVDEDIAAAFAHARKWLDELKATVGEGRLLIEASFAWDPDADAAEHIGYDRDYSKANGRVTGTADLVLVVTVDGKAIAAMVWDWKSGTGWGAGPQLRQLAVMVARTFDVEQVTVAALELTDDGVTEVVREDLDSFGLSAAAGEVADLLSQVDGAEPTPGAHCGELYCPARLTCPASQAAAAELVDDIPADALATTGQFKLTDPITTPEHAAWAVDVIRLVNAKLESIKDTIKKLVPAEGWPLADGRILKEGSCKSSGFSKEKAIELCKELGATDEQLGGLYYQYEKSTGLRVSGGASKPRTKRSPKLKEKAA